MVGRWGVSGRIDGVVDVDQGDVHVGVRGDRGVELAAVVGVDGVELVGVVLDVGGRHADHLEVERGRLAVARHDEEADAGMICAAGPSAPRKPAESRKVSPYRWSSATASNA